MIELVPKTAPIAGRDKVMITFRKPANAEPPSDDEEVVQFTDDDDAPFYVCMCRKSPARESGVFSFPEVSNAKATISHRFY